MPANNVGKPPSDIELTPSLVRQLLTEQHPDLADLPIAPLASGWDNAMFRLGEHHTVRLPRRAIAAPLIVNEQAWLPQLARRLPIAISAPVRTGRPSREYPWHWSVLPWFDGELADRAPVDDSEVDRFVGFLKALHQPAPVDAPVHPARGVALRAVRDRVDERFTRVRASTDLLSDDLLQVWNHACEAEFRAKRCWLHGDLHAQNVLILNGRINAIIDWGDLTAGDVATDLTAVWALFESQAARDNLLALYNPDPPTLMRSAAWTVWFGVILVDVGMANSPRHLAQGVELLRRLAEDIGTLVPAAGAPR